MFFVSFFDWFRSIPNNQHQAKRQRKKKELDSGFVRFEDDDGDSDDSGDDEYVQPEQDKDGEDDMDVDGDDDYMDRTLSASSSVVCRFCVSLIC